MSDLTVEIKLNEVAEDTDIIIVDHDGNKIPIEKEDVKIITDRQGDGDDPCIRINGMLFC